MKTRTKKKIMKDYGNSVLGMHEFKGDTNWKALYNAYKKRNRLMYKYYRNDSIFEQELLFNQILQLQDEIKRLFGRPVVKIRYASNSCECYD